MQQSHFIHSALSIVAIGSHAPHQQGLLLATNQKTVQSTVEGRRFVGHEHIVRSFGEALQMCTVEASLQVQSSQLLPVLVIQAIN